MLRFVLSTFLLVVAVATQADATVGLPADLQTMARGSELIVRGRVIDVQSRLTSGRRTIESLVTFEVVEAIKGSAPRTVTIRVPGGQIGRYRRVTIGAPRLRAGEELILFLRSQAPELPTIFGLNQGVYHVSGGSVVRRASTVPAFVRDIRASLEGRP